MSLKKTSDSQEVRPTKKGDKNLLYQFDKEELPHKKNKKKNRTHKIIFVRYWS